MNYDRGNFTSRLGIILATAGSAVGLGNIWRFPVETGENGGAAFILVYLACVLLLGIPMMTAEFIIGRRTHANITDAYKILLREERKVDLSEKRKVKSEKYKLPDEASQHDAASQPDEASQHGETSHPHKGKSYFSLFSFPFSLNSLWPITGYAGMLCVTLILSYYSVVAGWILKYAVDAFTGHMALITDTTAYFTDFSTSTVQPIVYTIVFILITHLVIERGVQNGIERFSKLMMPILLILMLLLVAGCLTTMPGAADGVAFLLKPDFSKLTPAVVLSAMGQAFFSLSIAIGCLSTYASYFKPDVPLLKTAANVVGLDTMVAIISGFIIFPAVFSVDGVQPDAGPGLVFVTLPSIFNTLFVQTPVLGYLFSLLFYILLVLAALTSTISMHEEVTAFFFDRYHISRRRAASVMTVTAIILAVLCSLSFGLLADFRPFFGRGFFEAFNDLTAMWIMPLSGIAMSIFVGWRLPRHIIEEELTNCGTLKMPDFTVPLFLFLIRWLAPIAILAIFFSML